MEIRTLVTVLDQPHLAEDYLHRWGLRDLGRGQQILLELAETGLTLDLLAGVCQQLSEHLPQTPDPDAALAAFHRYLFAVRSPLALAALFERDATAMPMLLSALALGSRWADLLVNDPEVFDLLRQTVDQPINGHALRSEIQTEIAGLHEERAIVAALVRTRQRHLFRIAYGEIVGQCDLEVVSEQLSQLAAAMIESALAASLQKAHDVKPSPRRFNVQSVRSSVIVLGPLGAGEPSYALPLSLLVVYDAAVEEAATLRAVQEYFDRVAKGLARLLKEVTGEEVRLLGLPDGHVAAAAHSAEDVIVGLDSFGRTWHRQEMLKARPVAGDLALGNEILARLETWLFRRYLGRADETGIKALKRRVMLEGTLHQDDWRDARHSRGGLRDIESTVEFLQLLAGGDQPAARQQGTLAALAGLETAGAVTREERMALEESYIFLRRLEHRLQILATPPASRLPDHEAVVARIAAGFGDFRDGATFIAALRHHQDNAWRTIDRLLASAFPSEPPTPREVDLLLDPSPPPEEIRAALSPFGFQHPEQALATLNDLAAEHVAFLSTRRCRHLLATILPQLLCAVGTTPDPDRTLDNVARVGNSLGGKGVLWDLFRASPPTLDLYVKLCAASPYLSDILTTNPGMVDELVDSLQLNKLPTRSDLEATLTELSRGAVDLLPILQDFKNAEHLRIGVRELLGKDDIDATHDVLADVAEACLAHVADNEYQRLVERYGSPAMGPGPKEGELCHFVIVGLGKLGGREPNYHSHLDVLFLYEADGVTRARGRSRRIEQTANNHFFTQLAQRIIKQLSQHTPKGQLYAVDALLRPIGIGGALALTFADFVQHFAGGAAPLWQWQALCQARPVFGDNSAILSVSNLIRQLLADRQPCAADAAEVRTLRSQLEKGATSQNLKRGPGGTLDVEFIVQMLQLRDGAAKPAVLTTNTQSALVALAAAGSLSNEMAERLGNAYRFLRRVESGICLMNAASRHDLPVEDHALRQLAFLLGHSNPARLREQCLQAMADNRAAFDLLTGAP